MPLLMARLCVYGGLALAGLIVSADARHCTIHDGCHWIYMRRRHQPCCVFPLHRTDEMLCFQHVRVW
jgi:hypothetical protein